MSKTLYPPAQPFPVSTNATTFGPQAVSVITPSRSYQAITAVVVAEREDGKLKLSVFRASTSPGGIGYYSREDYARGATGRFERIGKSAYKFEQCVPPAAAKLTKVDGQDLYTLHDLTNDEIEALRAALPELLRG